MPVGTYLICGVKIVRKMKRKTEVKVEAPTADVKLTLNVADKSIDWVIAELESFLSLLRAVRDGNVNENNEIVVNGYIVYPNVCIEASFDSGNPDTYIDYLANLFVGVSGTEKDVNEEMQYESTVNIGGEWAKELSDGKMTFGEYARQAAEKLRAIPED